MDLAMAVGQRVALSSQGQPAGLMMRLRRQRRAVEGRGGAVAPTAGTLGVCPVLCLCKPEGDAEGGVTHPPDPFLGDTDHTWEGRVEGTSWSHCHQITQRRLCVIVSSVRSWHLAASDSGQWWGRTTPKWCW